MVVSISQLGCVVMLTIIASLIQPPSNLRPRLQPSRLTRSTDIRKLWGGSLSCTPSLRFADDPDTFTLQLEYLTYLYYLSH